MTDPIRVTVFCDADSHAPKVETVDRLELFRGKVVRCQERHRTRTPSHSREDLAYDRFRLRCDLCGLDVQLSQQTARQLMEGLLEAGVLQVRLPELAATLA